MAKHFINENCINCFDCIDVCPREAITVENDTHVIDQDACTDCGACDDICPAGAIKFE